jgi:hypothetical protein
LLLVEICFPKQQLWVSFFFLFLISLIFALMFILFPSVYDSIWSSQLTYSLYLFKKLVVAPGFYNMHL